MGLCRAPIDLNDADLVWPCQQGNAWTYLGLAGSEGDPTGSAVRVVGGNVVAMFMESDALIMAMCPLGHACASAASWRSATVHRAAGFSAFTGGYSAFRSPAFFSTFGSGRMLIDRSSDVFRTFGGGKTGIVTR